MIALLIVLLAGVLVAGCGTDDGASPTPPKDRPPASGGGSPGPTTRPPSARDLLDRAFISAEATENGKPRPLVPGTHIRVAFFEQPKGRRRVGWRAGCNGYGGDVEFTDNRLLIGLIAGTLIGCSDELSEQDQWLGHFFSSDPKWRLSDDRLVLSSADTVIELEASRTR
jgi:heat shock protein HslJ